MSDVHTYILEMLKQYIVLVNGSDGAYDFVKWMTGLDDEQMYEMLKDDTDD